MSAVLTLLRIRNLALVEELEWQIGLGFVAVTGETGAGKSIIIGALQLLLGERADLKKQPAAKARLRLAVAQCG
jgi:DNA repair protein RecN (Recombination protein N)